MAVRSKSAPVRGKYPWAQWADGEWWTAFQKSPSRIVHGDDGPSGYDFTCSPVDFRTLAYRWASRNGKKAHALILKDEAGGGPRVEFMFYDDPDRSGRRPTSQELLDTPVPDGVPA